MAKTSGKVSPESMQVILLDELVGRMAELQKTIPHAGSGIMQPMVLNVASAIQQWICAPGWFGVTVYNDGPDAVYLDVNRDYNAVNRQVPLNMGEHLDFDYNQPKILRLYFQCQPAQSCQIRMFARY